METCQVWASLPTLFEKIRKNFNLETITFGNNLIEARQLLGSALAELAETNLMQGESLPKPNPSCTDPEADLEEPIYLLLTATPRVQIVPKENICYEAVHKFSEILFAAQKPSFFKKLGF